MKSSDMLLYACMSTNHITKQLNFQGAWNVRIKINFETTTSMISDSCMVLSLSLSLSQFLILQTCKLQDKNISLDGGPPTLGKYVSVTKS
jgi:hypothetical protein